MNTRSLFNRSKNLAWACALLFAAPIVTQGQFNYVTNNGAITITGYTGPGGTVNIPAQINGLPVASIGNAAFENKTNLISVVIPDTVTSVGYYAFLECLSLTSVTMGNGVTSIGYGAFSDCPNLTSVTIPNSVSTIEGEAFDSCYSLTNVTIGTNVTSIGDRAFGDCNNLARVYFSGNAPTADELVFGDGFSGYAPATVYYLPRTTGWSNTFARLSTALWLPQMQTADANFGARSNQFGFNITWASGRTVAVQAATNLSNPVWVSVATNVLSSGTSYFADAAWTNYPERFYRLSAP